ncbi:hypothetical protein FGO68_gene10060 [Halteria grandinella]|uniref:Uncharacterized protein n=1 Tax=Halteria grandinella TaxID=5974 RepID=A0A8J8NIB1_HALGN|nr:hypothetical protein FGO68_gene10060 [Halteria grandinella]
MLCENELIIQKGELICGIFLQCLLLLSLFSSHYLLWRYTADALSATARKVAHASPCASFLFWVQVALRSMARPVGLPLLLCQVASLSKSPIYLFVVNIIIADYNYYIIFKKQSNGRQDFIQAVNPRAEPYPQTRSEQVRDCEGLSVQKLRALALACPPPFLLRPQRGHPQGRIHTHHFRRGVQSAP